MATISKEQGNKKGLIENWLNRPDLIGLAIARGEDHFSMSHGSFKYKRKTDARQTLEFMQSEDFTRDAIAASEEADASIESLKTTSLRRITYGKDGRPVAYLYIKDLSTVEMVGDVNTVPVDPGNSTRDTGDGIKKIIFRWAETATATERESNRFFLSFPSEEDERIFGCGENYLKLDLKGEKVRIWVAEHQNTIRIAKKMLRWKLTSWAVGRRPEKTEKFSVYESYYSQPTFQSDRKYFIHAATSGFAVFDFKKKDRTVLELEEAPVIYIGQGEKYQDVSKKLYHLLTTLSTATADEKGKTGQDGSDTSIWPASIGKADRPSESVPDWVMDGIILAVQRGTDDVQDKIDKIESAGGKIAGIWSQDWCGCRKTGFGYQVMWNWKWDQELYPNLDKKIPEWKEKGIHFLGYINPFLSLEGDIYKEAREKGYCVKDSNGEDYLVKITTFPAAMVDFTNPDAYEWYKNIIKTNMIGFGLSGWMADFGEYLPHDCVLKSGEDPAVIHNTWPAVWAKLNLEAIRECNKEDEIFFFTRAGHTGTVSQSMMMWTGDQHVDWSVDDGLPAVIPATFSLAMSGYPVAHSDAGGYTTVMDMTRPKELLERWLEMNTFSPLLRTHEGNQPARDVQFYSDNELIKLTAKCSQIHNVWKPYIRELVKTAKTDGIPVMRPLFYEYEDRETYDIKDQYLLGKSVMVCPVTKEGQTRRTVYLPDGEWEYLWEDKTYKGGKIELDAPIGRIPVFVKNGTDSLRGIIDRSRQIQESYK